MEKKSKLDKKIHNVIVESAKLFYFNGYVNTGINDILEVCKIPKGSFYYYFKNKDDLLSKVIDYHMENTIKFFDSIVDDLSIYKLKSFFSQYLNTISLNKFHGGSPLGNLSSELSDINEEIRIKLNHAYFQIENRISLFLQTLACVHKKYQSENIILYSNLLLTHLEASCLKLKRTRDKEVIDEFLNFFDIIIEKMINDK